jgi:hydrogenase 3 maturation protease
METIPTSKSPWPEALEQTLERLSRADRPARVAIVGIGHELCGDDAAGVVAARALRRLVSAHDWLLVIDAGPAPENSTGPLRRFAPDLVLLIDAAQMGAPPGAVQWVDWRSASGLSASTHTLPCATLGRYLVAQLGCEVALLGIQPAGTCIGARLSGMVRRAVQTLVQRLSVLFCKRFVSLPAPPLTYTPIEGRPPRSSK